MYGLKQAGILENKALQKRLSHIGYYPARYTAGLWLHKTRKISFTLVVDEFAVKFAGIENAHHLRNSLLHSYKITNYWGGAVYSGMTLKWDDKKKNMTFPCQDMSPIFLIKSQHKKSKHPQNPPSNYVTPVYGAKTQYAIRDETPNVSSGKCIKKQKITGSVLYYTRAVDPSVLMTLNAIATDETKPPENTKAAADQILD